MGEQSGLSKRSLTLVAVGASVGFLAVVVALVVFAVTFLRASDPVQATPDQDTFEAIRLEDGDVAYLGLDAGDGGHTPSKLATAATKVASQWRDVGGTPDECMFAGAYPGTSVYPVWGTEVESNPLWQESSVSATQTINLDGAPLARITSRVFESAAAAEQFLLAHNQAVPGCPDFTIDVFQGVSRTTLTPLLFDTLPVSNTGWVAETDAWTEYGAALETPVDLHTWVINMQHGKVVSRLLMLVPAEFEEEAGQLFAELAYTVSRELVASVTE